MRHIILILVAVTALNISCVPAAPIVAAGGAVIIDCLAQDRDQLAALAGALWNAVMHGAPWSTVEQQAIANGETLGGCALAEVVQKYLSPAPGRAAPDPESGRAARTALEDFRTKHARGATFKTRYGDL